MIVDPSCTIVISRNLTVVTPLPVHWQPGLNPWTQGVMGPRQPTQTTVWPQPQGPILTVMPQPGPIMPAVPPTVPVPPTMQPGPGLTVPATFGPQPPAAAKMEPQQEPFQTVFERPTSAPPSPPAPPSISLPREEDLTSLPQKVADKEKQMVNWIKRNSIKKEKSAREVREVFDSDSD